MSFTPDRPIAMKIDWIIYISGKMVFYGYDDHDRIWSTSIPCDAIELGLGERVLPHEYKNEDL